MSPASPSRTASPLAVSLAALHAVAEREPDRRWAHCGDLAMVTYGAVGQVEDLAVLALTPLTEMALGGRENVDFLGSERLRQLGSGVQVWLPPGGLAIRWTTPTPPYVDFWQAALDSASGTSDASGASGAPSAPSVLSPAALAATLLMERDGSDVLLGLLIAGSVDFDAVRDFTLTHLGPYALDDMEAEIQDAEWALMRQRYTQDERLL